MTERHFRVVQLDGKKVEFGGVSITSKASPGSAARKLLTSIAHEKGLKKNKKASMPKVKFCIQEYTQGSSKKVYGPYVGHFHKYTAAELKKAKTAKGKIKFTMKPVVKLAKGNMKGGNGYEVNRSRNSIESISSFVTAPNGAAEQNEPFISQRTNSSTINTRGNASEENAGEEKGGFGIFNEYMMSQVPDFEKKAQEVPTLEQGQKYGLVIYKKTEKDLLLNKDIIGLSKYSQKNLNKMTNNKKNELLNNVKIMILNNDEGYTKKKIDFINKNLFKSRTGSCYSDLYGSKIRLRLGNGKVYCLRQNKEFIEKYTKKNSLKVGDIVIWDEKNNEWNKLITKNNVDNSLSRMKMTTGAGHDFYTSVKFFARMVCTAYTDIHVKTLQSVKNPQNIVYACGSQQVDPGKWKCMNACTKK